MHIRKCGACVCVYRYTNIHIRIQHINTCVQTPKPLRIFKEMLIQRVITHFLTYPHVKVTTKRVKRLRTFANVREQKIVQWRQFDVHVFVCPVVSAWTQFYFDQLKTVINKTFARNYIRKRLVSGNKSCVWTNVRRSLSTNTHLNAYRRYIGR